MIGLNRKKMSLTPLGRFSLLGLILVGGSPAVRADITPPVSNDPSSAQQVPVEPPPRPAGKDNFVLPPLPFAAVLPDSAKSVQIREVQFEGNKVISDDELAKVTAEFLNRPLSAGDLELLRRKVSQYYYDKGYINSGAVFSSQSVADGVFKLNIIEGKLTQVRQSGQGRLQEFYIRDRLIAGGGDPLNINGLKNSYELLKYNNPLIQDLNMRFMPGVRPGEATLDVNVTRSRPYQLYLGADDYSTAAVGTFAGRMGGWVDNILGVGERIDAQFIANGGALGYNTGISLPITAYDTRAEFRFTQSNSTLSEGQLAASNIYTQITGFDGGLAQPVYRTLSDNLTLGLNISVRESQTLQNNSCINGSAFTGIANPPSDTSQIPCSIQATVLRMKQSYKHISLDSGTALVFNSTFNAGLNALGALPPQSGGQGGDFFSWLGQSMFDQRILPNGAKLVLRGNLQVSDRPLVPLERFALGGAYTVRGYQQNTYIRDNGFNTNLEIKYPILDWFKYLNLDLSEDKHNLYLVPFLDYGGAWFNPTPATHVSTATNYLLSTGIGFNWQYKHIATDFYWAHAFTPANPAPLTSNAQSDGFFFRVNYNVF